MWVSSAGWVVPGRSSKWDALVRIRTHALPPIKLGASYQMTTETKGREHAKGKGKKGWMDVVASGVEVGAVPPGEEDKRATRPTRPKAVGRHGLFVITLSLTLPGCPREEIADLSDRLV